MVSDTAMLFKFFILASTLGAFFLSHAQAGYNPQKVSQLEERCQECPDTFAFTQEIPKNEHWARQNWTFYLSPVHDGIEMLLIV